MALLLSSVQFQPRVRIVYSVGKRPIRESTILWKRDRKSKTQFCLSKQRFRWLYSAGYSSVEEYPKVDSRDKLVKWIEFVKNVLPGGNWWRLSSEDVDVGATSKPVTVVRALNRMWELIAEDRFLIFAAFTALIVTAVCSPCPPLLIL